MLVAQITRFFLVSLLMLSLSVLLNIIRPFRPICRTLRKYTDRALLFMYAPCATAGRSDLATEGVSIWSFVFSNKSKAVPPKIELLR
jgi:hypothetical protein